MKRKVKTKKKKSIILRVLILGVCAYFFITLGSLWKELDTKRSELKTQEELRATKEIEIEELRALLDSDNEKKIIEKAARERFGYAYPNEQIFKDTSGN